MNDLENVDCESSELYRLIVDFMQVGSEFRPADRAFPVFRAPIWICMHDRLARLDVVHALTFHGTFGTLTYRVFQLVSLVKTIIRNEGSVPSVPSVLISLMCFPLIRDVFRS